jgi:choline-phosphate cytidylyltransferase
MSSKRGAAASSSSEPESQALRLLRSLRATKSAARLKEEREGKGAPVRVYADGIYDMFHYGHARSLEQAKKLFPNTCLVVGGEQLQQQQASIQQSITQIIIFFFFFFFFFFSSKVCDDASTHAYKGRTVMNEEQRAESVRHCKWVDEVVEHPPWVVTAEFMQKHRIDYVAHGEDISYDADGNDAYKDIKAAGMYQVIKRTEGISTSDLILTIVRDYDTYVRRNLKRGYSAKDMNVSFLKRAQIGIEDTTKSIQRKTSDIVGQAILHPIQRFIGLFDKNSRWLTTKLLKSDDESSGEPVAAAAVAAKDEESENGNNDDDVELADDGGGKKKRARVSSRK